MSAEARVNTVHARRYLGDVCRQLKHRAETKSASVQVEWTETDGIVDFGWARCTMHADETTLTLHAGADDEAGLRQVCELITRHLEHAGGEELSLNWAIDGTPGADGHAEGRDTMHAFHRRMRH
jgi:hypothetical protein